MRRGDIVTVALQGDSGKPRPALVIQGDAFDALAMVALLPLTSTILPTALTRIYYAHDTGKGLQSPSQVMVHRISSVRREKIGAVIGHLDDVTMLAVSRAIVVFLGLA
jgi:mRNA interferase MazF